MDHDIPDVNSARTGAAPNQSVNDLVRDDHDTPEELRERAELAAELEALLDAEAASNRDSEIEEFFQETREAQQVKMAEQGHGQLPHGATDPGAGLSEDSKPKHELPPRSPLQPVPVALQEGPLLPSPADRATQSPEVQQPNTPVHQRVKRIPVSPIKKYLSQQFLLEAREDIRTVAEAYGSSKDIPDPDISPRSSKKRKDEKTQSDTKRVLGPAKDSKEVLVDLMNAVDRDDPAESGIE